MRHFLALLLTITSLYALPSAICAEPLPLDTDADIQEHVLPNGLKVLVREYQRAPVALLMVAYRIGGRNERDGLTGLAHVVEHMMFQGTPTYNQADIDYLVEASGGSFNAFTNEDYTGYYIMLPKDRIELAMKLESDRMQNCIMDSAEFVRELDVVREEMHMRVSDKAQSRFSQELDGDFYRRHPYRNPVIGWPEDLDRLSVQDLRAFYHTHYVPNNAVIGFAGDIAPKAALALIEKYFGKIPPVPQPKALIVAEPEQLVEKRVTMRTSGVAQPEVWISFKGVATGDSADPVLGTLADLLGQSHGNRLQRELVERLKIATDVGASSYAPKDAGAFNVRATCADGVLPESVEAELWRQVERAWHDPPSTTELRSRNTRLIASRLRGRETVIGQVFPVIATEMRGAWKWREEYLKRSLALTPEDVRAGAEKYLRRDHSIVGILLPDGSGTGGGGRGARGKAGLTPDDAPLTPSDALASDVADAGLDTRDPSADIAFFSEMGVPKKPKSNAVVEPIDPKVLAPMGDKIRRQTLNNGLTLIVMERRDLPLVSIDLRVAAGAAYDPDGQSGAARMTATMLTRGTTKVPYEKLNDSLDAMAASFSADLDENEDAAAAMNLTSDKYYAGLALFAELVRNPAFPADGFDTEREQLLAQIAENENDAGYRAQIAFDSLRFAGHPYSKPRNGTPEQIKSLTAAQVKSFHANYWTPRSAYLTIVGDVDANQVLRDADRLFGTWTKPANAPSLAIPSAPTPSDSARRYVSLPGKVQANISWGVVGPKVNDLDIDGLQLLSQVLGGTGLASRLAANLRQQHGLVYGIGSAVRATYQGGTFRVGTMTRATACDSALTQIRAEMAGIITTPPTDRELVLAKNSLLGGLITELASNSGVARRLGQIAKRGQPLSFWDWKAQRIAALTLDDLKKVAEKYLESSKTLTVIAGPFTADGTPIAPSRPAGGHH